MSGDDIGDVLKGWQFRPGKVTARKIIGDDGRERVQLRLDLGLLQMEMSGRPDGLRPYGKESLLEYYEERIARYKARRGTDEGFKLSSPAVSALAAESVQYYYRYLALFSLGDFAAVARDTARNLRVLDLVKAHAASPADGESLEGYRPYIVMMKTRAHVHRALLERRFREALDKARSGVETIEDHLARSGRPELAASCKELQFLKSWATEIEEAFPADPAVRLRKELDVAVGKERYEEAARIRDALQKLDEESQGE
jgi:hypothetical protein